MCGFNQVVPLSQRSGLLEWCEGTVPMGEYLIGSNGAHQRYRPDDMRALECRKRMQVDSRSLSSAEKNQRSVYLSQFSPKILLIYFLRSSL